VAVFRSMSSLLSLIIFCSLLVFCVCTSQCVKFIVKACFDITWVYILFVVYFNILFFCPALPVFENNCLFFVDCISVL
jgi:hypothetical protein